MMRAPVQLPTSPPLRIISRLLARGSDRQNPTPCGSTLRHGEAPARGQENAGMRKTTSSLGASLLLMATALTRPQATPLTPSQPARVQAGSYQGTWYYSDRTSRLAFWFDEQQPGKVKARYRYQLRGAGFGDSGETGTGPCSSGTGPGTFKLSYRLEQDGVIRGRMVRTWPAQDGEMVESNDFEAYRTGLGEELYCVFKNTV